MGVGHATTGTFTGCGRPTTLLARMGGDRSIPDVGVNSARGSLVCYRPGLRRRLGGMGLVSGEVCGAQAMDASGNITPSRYGCDGVVRQVGVGVLQQRIPRPKGGTEGLASDYQHETNKLWLGASATVSSYGGPQRVPSDYNPGCVDTIVGLGRGLLSPDVAYGDHQVLRCRGAGGTIRKVPRVHFRMGAVDVLCKQAIRDFSNATCAGSLGWQFGPTWTILQQRSRRSGKLSEQGTNL